MRAGARHKRHKRLTGSRKIRDVDDDRGSQILIIRGCGAGARVPPMAASTRCDSNDLSRAGGYSCARLEGTAKDLRHEIPAHHGILHLADRRSASRPRPTLDTPGSHRVAGVHGAAAVLAAALGVHDPDSVRSADDGRLCDGHSNGPRTPLPARPSARGGRGDTVWRVDRGGTRGGAVALASARAAAGNGPSRHRPRAGGRCGRSRQDDPGGLDSAGARGARSGLSRAAPDPCGAEGAVAAGTARSLRARGRGCRRHLASQGCGGSAG